jgi:hypothetical protein
MSSRVEHGATLRCQFGSTLAPLRVPRLLPWASVRDSVPFVNIQPFGACSCPGNPQVAMASRAARGVLAPMPCVPAVDEPWQAGSTQRSVGGVPALAPDSTARCRWGGLISLLAITQRDPGQGEKHG